MSGADDSIKMEDNDPTSGAAGGDDSQPLEDVAPKSEPTSNESTQAENNQQGAAAKADKKEDNSPSGYIAKGLDPVGKYAQKGLSPIGYGVEKTVQPITGLVGGITKPILGAVAGTKDEKAEILGGEKKAEDFKRKPILTNEEDEGDGSIGGKEQTADNPLGL